LRSVTIARNYAEALFELGGQSGRAAEYADLLDTVAQGIAAAPRVEAVLMSPRITKAQKSGILAAALPDAPHEFVLFLQAVVRRGRQDLLREMAAEYIGLLDQKLNRVRASVTLTRAADARLRQKITEQLTRVMGKEVLPSFMEDRTIIGGILVRFGDRVFDGSIRRRAVSLRRQLLRG
jgi:F-type H+-transporting ATPase subunit delta